MENEDRYHGSVKQVAWSLWNSQKEKAHSKCSVKSNQITHHHSSLNTYPVDCWVHFWTINKPLQKVTASYLDNAVTPGGSKIHATPAPLCLLSPPRRISSSSAPPILTVTSFWLCSQTSRLHWDVVKGTTRCFVKFYFTFNSYDTFLWDSVWCFGVLSLLFKRIFFFKRREIQKISSQMKRELSRRKKNLRVSSRGPAHLHEVWYTHFPCKRLIRYGMGRGAHNNESLITKLFYLIALCGPGENEQWQFLLEMLITFLDN